MTQRLINWEQLKPYDKDQCRSFEELCYQIAKKQFEKEGQFTSIDDSGGGDGVEFYLTFPNGDQWGWQAKLYLRGEGLDDGGRKTAIKKSLRKAHEVHPHLKKFFLCTPKNLTPQEQNWYAKELATSILDGRAVLPSPSAIALERWGESDFIAWMSEERFAGIWRFFFGELELSMDWFKRQFAKQAGGVREKFSPSLHTSTQSDAVIHRILADDYFYKEVGKLLVELARTFADCQKAFQELRGKEPISIKWADTKKTLIQAVQQTEADLKTALEDFRSAAQWITERRLDLVRSKNWELVRKTVADAEQCLRVPYAAIDLAKVLYAGKPEYEGQTRAKAALLLEAPIAETSEFCELAENLIEAFMSAQGNDLHLLGNPGSGKTQLSAQICDDRLKAGLPAIFLLGKHFTGSDPVEQQLLKILDIPRSYSWHDFLHALDATASAHRTRIPVFIDGLNEAVRNGTFSDVWKLGLRGLSTEFADTSDIVLFTTCRESYKDYIWGVAPSRPQCCVTGFDYDNVEQAAQKYFDEYKIKADLTTESLEHFTNPIYLKLFCEAKNPERKEVKSVFIGKAGLFEVFEEFLAQCNRAIQGRTDLHPSTNIVRPALTAIAEHIWKEKARGISLANAVRLIDGASLDELEWERSRTRAIESEGLLVYRDWTGTGEQLCFTYDLLAGYCVARWLVQINSSRLVEFVNEAGTVDALFSTDYTKLHPLHEDISRSLAAAIRIYGGQYLHRISKNNVAFSRSIDTLFEIDAEQVDSQCREEVLRLFQHPKNRRPIFRAIRKTITINDHPLGVSLLHSALAGLSMPERDLCWTEHLRSEATELESFAERIRALCSTKGTMSDAEAKRIHASARYMMWMLTSTMRPFRDKVTRSLYYYGRRFSKDFFALLIESLAINDIYVPERMFAAAYGVCMARQNDFNEPGFAKEELPEWARWIYANLFVIEARFSTTHILMRDYARRICEIANVQDPTVFGEAEIGRLRPPYKDGGLRDWDAFGVNKNLPGPAEGSPFRMDFENYTLGRLVERRNNYDFKNKSYQKERECVLGRVFQLGWNAKDFHQIDQEIARNQNAGRVGFGGAQTDRYGKKYSWIAYFERLGVVRDSGIFDDRFDADRVSDADLDPSFPNPIAKLQIVKTDFLEDGKTTNEDWIENGPKPALAPYLVLPDLEGATGPWIILDSYLTQECKKRDRRIFAFIRSFLIREQHFKEFIIRLTAQDLGGRWLPEKHDTYYCYAGEIPWSDSWPSTNESQMFFDLNGRRKAFEVIIPVRDFCWESYHSTVNVHTGASVLVRDMALDLQLVGQPQTFDLYGKDGRVATRTIQYSHDSNDHQQFVVIRKDLLDDHLKRNKLRMVWAIWGEREYSNDTNLKVVNNTIERPEPFYKLFQEIVPYSEGAEVASRIAGLPSKGED